MTRSKTSPDISSPQRRSKWPIIGIYITHEDKKGLLNYVGFYTKEEAQVWLKHLTTIHGLYDPDKNDIIFEQGWKLSTRDNSTYNDLPKLLQESEGPHGASVPVELLAKFQITRPTAEIRTQDEPSRASHKTKIPRDDNLIFLSSLVKDPGLARQMLRQAKIAKPASGQWAWDPSDPSLAEVKKILKVS